MERRGTSAVLLTVLVVGGCGCERGCLARWLGDRGVGGLSAEPEGVGSGAAQGPRGLGLEGTDCSDGLLRCVGGRVEASRAAHLSRGCGGREAERPTACVCPWDVVTECASGCVREGLEAIGAPTDASAAQLCRPSALVARPVLPGDPVPTDICVSEGVACVDGIVRACEAPGLPTRAVAICLKGCEVQIGVDAWGDDSEDPGALEDVDVVTSLLCRRDHAERR